MVPATEPLITNNLLPVGTEVGSTPPVATTMVSAAEAQRPSWWLMHTPGPMPTHSVSAVQARQVFVVVLQMGVAPEQVVLSVHCTHLPVPVAQAA
jgi:predicted metal-dependent phosphotriesterase family hydrolase